MPSESKRRAVGFIEDVVNFIKNSFVAIVLGAFLLLLSAYIAAISFNYWQSDRLNFGGRYNLEKVFYNSWKSIITNVQNQDAYKDKLEKYYGEFYAPYLQQAEQMQGEQREQYIDQIQDKIDALVDEQLVKAEQPLPEKFALRLAICTFVPIGFFGLLVFFLRAPLADFRPFEKDETLHGDARWASEGDIKGAGLRAKEGLIVGKDNRGFLVAPGFQHALLFAPTGSGKGVGFVIPNLLYWHDSVFIHDIKLENFELTSGYRRDVLKQDVFLWAPSDPDGKTHCYNPIDWVSQKPGQMVDDVQKIANLILPEQEFWTNEARTLFVGVTLYLLAVPEKTKSFGEVVRTLRSDDVVYNLAVVLDTIGKKIHPVSYMNIAAFLQKADKERSGVISTLNSGLELWANPLIDTATASSDFNVQMMKRRKTTVYVGLTPDNIQRLQPLLQVFYQQATEFLSRKIPDPKEDPYGVLFMMDEFPTLGEMKQFHAGIAYFRGYNVRLFLIVQDTQQLKGIYEEHGMNTFLSNSTYRITFAANNVETANLISQLVGNKTVKQKSLNKPKYLDLNPATRTIHESEIQRALLLPQEVIGLARDEQIILIESTPPIKTKKVFYFKESFFKKRLLDPIEIPTQEPYDARKKEEEEKKKKEEEKKKKEAEAEEQRKKEEAERKAKEAEDRPEDEDAPAAAPVVADDAPAFPDFPEPPKAPAPEGDDSAANNANNDSSGSDGDFPDFPEPPKPSDDGSSAGASPVENSDTSDFPEFPDFPPIPNDDKTEGGEDKKG